MSLNVDRESLYAENNLKELIDTYKMVHKLGELNGLQR